MLFSIYGTDHYRCQEKLKELQASFIEKRDSSGLNMVNLNGEKAETPAMQSEIMATPFLGEKKMVIIKNIFSRQPTATGTKIRKELTDFLKLKNQSIDNALVFIDLIEPKKKLSGPLFQYLGKQKFCWEYNLLSDRQLESWVKKYLLNKKIKISQPAINELVIRVGSDLNRLTTEINKLSAYKKDEAIEVDDVCLLVNAKFDENIFNLVDAIGQKNRPLAIKLINDQLASGGNEIMMLKMIQRQFKMLLQIKNGATPASAGIHPFVFKKASWQIKNFTNQQLINIHSQLMELEVALKTSAKKPELLFDLFIFKNC